MMWIVEGEYCGCKAYWGTYEDEATADEVAKRVNGIKKRAEDVYKGR